MERPVSKNTTWYRENIRLLNLLLPQGEIHYDGEEYRWIYIGYFPLPSCIKQKTSRLVLLLPGINQPLTIQPRGFYIDKALVRRDGLPVMPSGSTSRDDLFHEGYLLADLFLPQWNPTYDVVSGDNLGSLLKHIYENLETRKENK